MDAVKGCSAFTWYSDPQLWLLYLRDLIFFTTNSTNWWKLSTLATFVNER